MTCKIVGHVRSLTSPELHLLKLSFCCNVNVFTRKDRPSSPIFVFLSAYISLQNIISKGCCFLRITPLNGCSMCSSETSAVSIKHKLNSDACDQ